MPNTFFNSNRKIPYIKFETADGEIQLGRNTVLNRIGDFNDDVFLKDVDITVASNYIEIEVTIEVLYRAWTTATFDDVLNKLVEEPYRLGTQRIDETKPGKKEGIWLLQIGWKGDGIEEALTPVMQCVTTANDITLLPEARGAMQLKKTLVMLPMIYLQQTHISLMERTREYITNQIDREENLLLLNHRK